MTRTKTIDLRMKALPESEGKAGTFTGYASVFGNKDSYGDIVVKGAFADSLSSYGEQGSNIPCYWCHDMSDPMKCIGWTTKAVEDDHGLLVDVQLDLDNPNGAQVHKLLKQGVVGQMSFAFEVEDAEVMESKDLGTYQELRKLKLFEVSVVQVGANQSTTIEGVKMHRRKVDDKIEAARALLQDIQGVDDLEEAKAKTKDADKLLSDVDASSPSGAPSEPGEKAVGDKDPNGDKVVSSIKAAQKSLTDALAALTPEGDDETDDPADDGSDEEQDDGKDEEKETSKSKDRRSVKSRTLSDVDIAELELVLQEGVLA